MHSRRYAFRYGRAEGKRPGGRGDGRGGRAGLYAPVAAISQGHQTPGELGGDEYIWRDGRDAHHADGYGRADEHGAGYTCGVYHTRSLLCAQRAFGI